jgi:hypothetical protein
MNMANSILNEFSDFFEDAKTEVSKNVPDLTGEFVQLNMSNIVDENTKLKNEVERLKKSNLELNFELMELRMFKLMFEKNLMKKELEKQNNNNGFHSR